MGPDPPRKSLCRALFSLPPLLDVTARCSSSAACPARGTAVSPSLATCFSPWRPGRTTTRGTPAVAEGVEVGVLEGVLVLPGLLAGGLVGGEEERGALRPNMTPLRLVDRGVRPPGASLDDIIHVVGMQSTCGIGTSGLSSTIPCSQSVRAQGGLSAARRGRVRRMRAMVVPEVIATLVSGWAARSVQPNASGPS